MTSTRLTLPLARLGCAAGEAQTIEHVLREAPGVTSAYLNPVNDTAYIEYDPRITDGPRLRSALEAAGFRPSQLPGERRMRDRQGWPPLDGGRIALAGGIWLLLVYSASIALLVLMGYAPGAGMGGVWEGLLIGFPAAFLYGAAGAWLFTAIYNLLPVGSRTSGEAR